MKTIVIGQLAQLLEPRANNVKVVGSKPTLAIINPPSLIFLEHSDQVKNYISREIYEEE